MKLIDKGGEGQEFQNLSGYDEIGYPKRKTWRKRMRLYLLSMWKVEKVLETDR